MENTTKTGVSVIICCHNSKREISQTLKHLSEQRTGQDLQWEVVLVDNASTDGTVESAVTTWKVLGSKVPLRVVNEPMLGVAYARGKGIRSASYEYIVFCDDDTWFCPNYVAVAFELLSQNRQVAAVSGWGNPVFESASPWSDPVNFKFGCRDKPAYEGKDPKPAVITMGLAIRRTVLLKLFEAGFDFYQKSRMGDQYNGGEDVEMTLMLSILGYQFWVSPRMYYQHFIPTARTTFAHLKKMSIGNGKVKTFILPYYWFYNRKNTIVRKNIFVQSFVALYWLTLNAFGKKPNSQFHALEYRTHLVTLPKLIFKFYRMQRSIKRVIKNYDTNSRMETAGA